MGPFSPIKIDFEIYQLSFFSSSVAFRTLLDHAYHSFNHVMIRSNNQGSTWKKQGHPFPHYYLDFDLRFLASNVFFPVQGKIIMTRFRRF